MNRVVHPDLHQNCTGTAPELHLVTKMHPFLHLLWTRFCILFVTKLPAHASDFWHHVTFYVTDSPLTCTLRMRVTNFELRKFWSLL
jgi:hypothetical protein